MLKLDTDKISNVVSNDNVHQPDLERSISAKEMWIKIERILNVAGITRVANVTGLDVFNKIHTYCAVRPNSKSYSVSQGKGVTPEQAKVSATMETLELYHAENLDLPVTEGTFKDIIENKKIINIHEASKSLDSRIHMDDSIEWLETKNFFDNETLLIPREIIDFDLTYLSKRYFITDSSGLAGANTQEEAITKGILECIERDSFASWCLANHEWKKQRLVDINTIKDTEILNFLKEIEDNLTNIYIWDITTDINIPAFMTLLAPKNYDGYEARFSYGTGSSLNKEGALMSSIIEAVQSRLTFISGARDDQSNSIYEEKMSLSFRQEMKHFLSQFNNTLRNFDDIVNYKNLSTAEGLNTLKKNLEKAKIKEICVTNLQRPEVNIPFVKVFIPELMNSEYLEQGTMSSRAKEYCEFFNYA